MALVVLLRGVNVGGYRSFRPSLLADRLNHLKITNIGAAGTFVVREPVNRSFLRMELMQNVPVETKILICEGREVLKLISQNPFIKFKMHPDIVFFVGLLSNYPRSEPLMPLEIPTVGEWLLKILGRKGKFIFGLYRRQMKTINYLNTLDHRFGASVTIRNWNTINTIAKVLNNEVS